MDFGCTYRLVLFFLSGVKANTQRLPTCLSMRSRRTSERVVVRMAQPSSLFFCFFLFFFSDDQTKATQWTVLMRLGSIGQLGLAMQRRCHMQMKHRSDDMFVFFFRVGRREMDSNYRWLDRRMKQNTREQKRKRLPFNRKGKSYWGGVKGLNKLTETTVDRYGTLTEPQRNWTHKKMRRKGKKPFGCFSTL